MHCGLFRLHAGNQLRHLPGSRHHRSGMLLMPELPSRRIDISVRSASGIRIEGATVLFFLDGRQFATIPSTRDKDPTIEIFDHSAVVQVKVIYRGFSADVTLPQNENEWTCTLPLEFIVAATPPLWPHAVVDGRESLELWVTAAEASHLLKPVFGNEFQARMTICKRAHNGLIRARAERFIVAGDGRDNQEIPEKFWWAEGHEALTQNWVTGDFETWIQQQLHMQAFGVSFLRADIEKLIPATRAGKVMDSTPEARRSAIIITALHVETQAALRHLSDVHEQNERGTVFQVGQFASWIVAVAQCGEGNVRAALTVDRAIALFKPAVALFVGVAGGIKDVSIGDALVATKIYGYERGKDTGEGFKPRPEVQLTAYAEAPRRLAEAARSKFKSHKPHYLRWTDRSRREGSQLFKRSGCRVSETKLRGRPRRRNGRSRFPWRSAH
jgi:hypothetical protein